MYSAQDWRRHFAGAVFTSLLLGCGTALAGEPDATPLAMDVGDTGLTWGDCPPFFSDQCRIAVLHGDPARPDADVFFRVPGGDHLPRHRHTSAERMVLVSGRLSVSYRGHEAMELTPGMYAYGPPGVPHEGDCLSESPCVLFIAFEEPVDAFPVK